MEKQAQSGVHYRPAHKERRCGACLHFHPAPSAGGACGLVEGPISPAMCCDLWRPLKHGARAAAGRPGGTDG